MNIENIKEIVKLIYNMNYRPDPDKDKSKEELLLADEINQGNYYTTVYKVMDLAKHEYDDYHFCVENIIYDVFVYRGEDIDLKKLLQVLLCNNYIQILKFTDGDYKNNINISTFCMTDKVYSFNDREVIIIECKLPSKCQYETLDIRKKKE